MTSVAQKRITLYATIHHIYIYRVVPRVVKFYGFFMKCRRMRRTLVTPAAMAAFSISPSLSPSPLHFHSFSHSCQSQGLCKETPNELHGRGTKTQFQFQFRFQFGFCFSVSNLNFNLQKCIGRKVSGSFCVCVRAGTTTSGGKQRCRCGAAAVATTIALDIDMRQISQQLNCAYAASTAPQLNKFQFISIKNGEAASPLPVSCCWLRTLPG